MKLFGATSIIRKIILEDGLVVVDGVSGDGDVGGGSGAAVGVNDAPLIVLKANHYEYDHIDYNKFSHLKVCSTCKCQDCKAKHDVLINAINALTAFVMKLASKRSVITSKKISYSSTPLEIKSKGRRKVISKALSNGPGVGTDWPSVGFLSIDYPSVMIDLSPIKGEHSSLMNYIMFFQLMSIFAIDGSHEYQIRIVGTQALVDPLDDEIDSPRENDLCPSGARTKVLLPSDKIIHTLVDPYEKQGESTLVCELPTTNEGEQNDQPGVDDLDLLEYLENPSCDCLCKDDFDCDPLAFHDGLYVCKDKSCERVGDMCLEMPSTSSLCVSYVGHISSGNFETSSLDSRSNPFQEGKDDTSQIATLIFEYMIGSHHLKDQDLVTPRA
ncbi:hypothetical protein FXO38_21734 [Capsicum annuum]|nr:hypothetical protein FXO38_21734 [Capsicum annuum]